MRQHVSTYGWRKKVHNCSRRSVVCLRKRSTRFLGAWDECNCWLGSHRCAVQHGPRQRYLITNQSAPSRRMPTSLRGCLRLTWVATLANAGSKCRDAIHLSPLAIVFDSCICGSCIHGCHTHCVSSPWAVFLFWVLGCAICQCVLLCHQLWGLIINVKTAKFVIYTT